MYDEFDEYDVYDEFFLTKAWRITYLDTLIGFARLGHGTVVTQLPKSYIVQDNLFTVGSVLATVSSLRQRRRPLEPVPTTGVEFILCR